MANQTGGGQVQDQESHQADIEERRRARCIVQSERRKMRAGIVPTTSQPVNQFGCIIYGRSEARNEKFKANTFIVHFSIEQKVKEEPLGPHNAITDLILSVTEGMSANTWISSALLCPENGKHINFPFVRLGAFTNEIIMQAIAGAAQSDDILTACQRFKLSIVTVEDLEGRGSRIMSNIAVTERTTVIEAKNDKNRTLAPILHSMGLAHLGTTRDACLFFAAVVGRDFHKCAKTDSAEWLGSRRQIGKPFSRKVAELIRDVNMNFSQAAGNTAILEKLDEVLNQDNYKLIVYSGLTEASKCYGRPYQPGDENKKKIFLYLNTKKKHYSAILSVKAFFMKNYWCDHCERVLDNKWHSNCRGSVCGMCMSRCHIEEGPEDLVDVIPVPTACNDCGITFRNGKCYKNHGPGTCTSRRMCKLCSCFYDQKKLKGGAHVCNTAYCRKCKSYESIPHRCYIKKKAERKNQKLVDQNTIYFAADFETTQEEEITIGDKIMYKHNANLVHAAAFCSLCRDKEFTENDPPCIKCGPRERSIDNFDDEKVSVAKELLEHVNRVCSPRDLADGRKMPGQKGIILMHNARGFDSHLLLQMILNDPDYEVDLVILNGLMILIMNLVNKHTKIKIKVIDTLSFAPAALSALPKCFKIANVEKGHFSHQFNKKENYNYNSPNLPPLETFDADNMSADKRAALLAWYEEAQRELTENGGTYNFKNELRKYCANDCYILRRAMTSYRAMFLPFNVDPFQETFTLASLANTVLLRNFYEEDTIGVLPKTDSYRSDQSGEGRVFLCKVIEDRGLPDLQCSLNGCEAVILGAPVDGYDPATKTVFQFHGDFWHACRHCYKNLNSIKDPTLRAAMRLRRMQTEMRTKLLRQKGYIVEEIYECKWREQMAADPVTYNRLKSDPRVVMEPLRSRNAFFGGRTNAIKLFYEAKEGEILRLLDFKSLYPTCNKYFTYPVKHPNVYTSNFPSILDVDGLVCCRVLPPGRLFHPVLPEKIDGKLVFHLCTKCAHDKQDTYCTHTDAERSFVGSWVSYELQLAIKMGYVIEEIYEIWDFPETRQYNRETGEKGLFSDYVDVFLKMKQVCDKQ